MASRLLTGIRFYLGFAPKFSRKGYERRGLGERPVSADFTGQRWLVTGASGGIGREIVAQAVNRGAGVTAVARSQAKLETLKQELDGPGEVEIRAADLSLRREVVDLAEAVADDEGDAVDVLVNNVGVLLNEHVVTDEGFEASFATNLLNHYVLTEELIARGLLTRGGVVINMSSGGMYTTPLLPGQLNMTDPQHHDGVAAYARHKRAQVELTHAWNRRHGPEVMFHVMHPGWVDTEGVRTSLPGFRTLFRPVLRTAEQGADTAIWLAAERPPVADEGIWLDRELHPEHVADHTRTDDERCTELVERLERWRSETPDGGTNEGVA
jgi:NAD(P)-dependent dehydrogenase (short-subunit alcohol dehydrogenase family)